MRKLTKIGFVLSTAALGIMLPGAVWWILPGEILGPLWLCVLTWPVASLFAIPASVIHVVSFFREGRDAVRRAALVLVVVHAGACIATVWQVWLMFFKLGPRLLG